MIQAVEQESKDGQQIKSTKAQPQDVQPYLMDLFQIFHYLYEDLKLQKAIFAQHGYLMAQFLVKYLQEMNNVVAVRQNREGGEMSADQFLNMDFSEEQRPLKDGGVAERVIERLSYLYHYQQDFADLTLDCLT